MGPLDISGLPDQALLLLDSNPLIYRLESNARLGARFATIFEAHRAGKLRFAVTTITIAEVMVGPLRAGNELLAREYKALLESWTVVPLNSQLAESAARLRALLRLALPDAIQAAAAIAINAAALVTYDRDFSRVTGIRVIS